VIHGVGEFLFDLIGDFLGSALELLFERKRRLLLLGCGLLLLILFAGFVALLFLKV
jgi:hypothetical protein